MHATEKGKLFTSLLASQPDGSVFSFNPQYWINPIWPVEETGVTWTDRYNDINDRQWATEVFVHVYSKPDYQKAIVKSDEQKLNAYLDLRYIRRQLVNDREYIEYRKNNEEYGKLTYLAYYIFEGSKRGIKPSKEFVGMESFDWKFYETANELKFDSKDDSDNAKDAYYHYLRKGLAKDLAARTSTDRFKIANGAIDKNIIVADKVQPAATTTPANTETAQPSSPEANPTTTASTNTSPATNSSSGTSTSTSNGSSSSGWDGTYSVETTGSATGWDTGNGWSATGVAALKRLQLSTPDAPDDVITGSGNRTQSLNLYSTYRHHDQVIGSTRKSSLLANASSRRGDRHKTTLAHTMNHQTSFRDAPVALVASGALKTTLGSSDLGWISSDQPIAAYGEHSILC